MVGHALTNSHVDSIIRKRLRRLSRTRTVERILLYLVESDAGRAECRAVVAISLVEMSARPMDARLLEWSLVLPGRSGVLGLRLKCWSEARTVGPLQLQHGPLSLRAAVESAIHRLQSARIDLSNLDEIAVFWNGPSHRASGSSRYKSVLSEAHEIAKVLLAPD